jgi:hypothetical protein
MAAALGSNTLVVTAKDALHILSLNDGSDSWTGTITGVTGPMKNPIVVGSTVYAIDTAGSGKLVALNP